MVSKDFATGMATGVIAKDIIDKGASIAQTREENTIIYKKCIEPNQTLFTEKECYIAIEKNKNYPVFDLNKPLISERTYLIVVAILIAVLVLRMLVSGLGFLVQRTRNSKDDFVECLLYSVPTVIILAFIMYVVN